MIELDLLAGGQIEKLRMFERTWTGEELFTDKIEGPVAMGRVAPQFVKKSTRHLRGEVCSGLLRGSPTRDCRERCGIVPVRLLHF
jgi:hypothetical protein